MAAPIFFTNQLISLDKWLLPFSVEINLYLGINGCSHFLACLFLCPPMSRACDWVNCNAPHYIRRRREPRWKYLERKNLPKRLIILLNHGFVQYGLGFTDGQTTFWKLIALSMSVKIATTQNWQQNLKVEKAKLTASTIS